MNKQYITPALWFVFAMTFLASNAWGQCARPYLDCDKVTAKPSICFLETFDVTSLLSAAGLADYNAAPGGGSFKLISGTAEYPIADPTRLQPGSIVGLRAGGCTLRYTGRAAPGTAVRITDDLTWTISEAPNVSPEPQNVCDGRATSVSMRNTNTNVTGPMSFAWSILLTAASNVQGGTEQTNEDVTTNRVTTDDGNAATDDACSPYTVAQTLSLMIGNTPGSAIYTITPIALISRCKGRATQVTVNVRSSPALSIPSPTSVCDGEVISLNPSISNGIPADAADNFLTVTVAKEGNEVTLEDVDPNTPAIKTANGKVLLSPFRQIIRVTGDVPKKATYTFTPKVFYANRGRGDSTVCVGQSGNVEVTVKPKPVLTGMNPDKICPITAPLPFAVNNYAGPIATFSYTGGGVAGLPPNANNLNNNPTLTNVGLNEMAVQLTGVTVYGDGCPSDPTNINFIILPTPVIQIRSVSLPTTWRKIDDFHYKLNLCHGGLLPDVTFDTDLAGGTYSWTNNQAAGGELGGNGGIASAVPLVNADGVTDKTGVLTLIAQGQCISKAEVEVIVHPPPKILTPPPAPVCSGTQARLEPGIDPPITRFGVTGLFTATTIVTDPGVSIDAPRMSETNQVPSPISQTLRVSGNIPKKAAYTITPWAIYDNNNFRNVNANERRISISCKGPTGVIEATVKPKPDLTGISPTAICAGTAPLPFTTSNYPDTPTHFSYTGGGNAGLSPGEANFIANNPTLVNNNALNDTGANDITVSLTNVIVKYGTDVELCPSNARDITFTVLAPRSAPVINITDPVPAVIIEGANPLPHTLLQTAAGSNEYKFNACHGEVFPALTFSSPSTPEGIFKYRWTNNQGAGGDSGGGNGAVPLFPLVNENADDADKTGVVMLIAEGCGVAVTRARIEITVHPRVVMTADPEQQRLCPGTPSQEVTFTSPLKTTSPVVPPIFIWDANPSFEWKITSSGETGGFPANGGTGLSMSSIPAVENNSSAILTVEFEVTGDTKRYPLDGSRCKATGKYSVLIHPKPTASAPAKTICTNTSPELDISAAPNNVPETVFTWKGTPASLGATDQVTNLSKGPFVIKDVLKLPEGSILPQQVTYTITPVEANNCKGDEITSVITVMPLPRVMATVVKSAICDGESAQITLDNNLRTNDIKYVWTVAHFGVTGGSNSLLQEAPGNDSPIQDALTLTGTTGGKATYTVWAISDIGCKSLQSATAEVTVRGKPAIAKDISSVTYCGGSNVSLRLETTEPTDLFKWYLLPPVGAPAGTPPTLLTDAAPYSGTTTATLTISKTPESYLGNRYQAEVTDGYCPNSSSQSAEAVLTLQFIKTDAVANKTSLVYGEKVAFSIINPPEGAAAKWLFGDEWYSEEVNTVHYYYKKGTFTPSVTVSMPFTKCSRTYTLPPVTVTGELTDGDVVTGDKDTGAENILSVFPNPVREALTVKSSGYSKVFLYNAMGQLQLEQEGNGTMEINFSDRPQGLFILKITNGEGEHWVKIIKE